MLSVSLIQKVSLFQKAEGGDHTATTNDLKKSSYLMLAHCFYETERYDQCELAAAKAKEIEVNAPSEFYLMSTALQQRKPEIAARHLTALITCKVRRRARPSLRPSRGSRLTSARVAAGCERADAHRGSQARPGRRP